MIRLLMMLVLICFTSPALAADMEITPFRTSNQRAFVQIFGLPAESSAGITPPGRLALGFSLDAANEFIVTRSGNEQIVLDGESYRWTLSARYGFAGRFEAGIDIPYILYTGGIFDGMIAGWHDAFGMRQGGRDTADKYRLNYTYSNNGVQKFRVDQNDSGIGDIVLSAGMKLYENQGSDLSSRLAVRTTVKLPTGDSSSLQGSGSTDFTLSLCGSLNTYTKWGSFGLFGSMGGMAMTQGDVLADQQKNMAGFGTIGLGWGPADWISFKLQLNGHTPMYNDSSLSQLSNSSLMVIGGGTLKLPGDFMLDIGVTEDIALDSAPDVGLHFGLTRVF